MKNRFLSMLIGAVLFVLSVAAENYPYRSDVLWVTVPDHADWLYKTGEKAKKRLRLKFSSINMVFRKMVWRFYMSWEAT